jgi:RNA polymerase sigma-70 factor (ECF subfamily)
MGLPKRKQSHADRARASGTDRDLVERILAGDEAAFTQLVRKLHGPLIRLARYHVASPAVAEEVAQETWLAVLDGLPKFEGRASLKSWIFRILSNRAKTRGTRERRSVPLSALGRQGEESEPELDDSRFTERGRWARTPARWEEDDPEQIILSTETLAAIKVCIDALPRRQRAVIQLRDVEGLTSQDVCNVLELSETNQRVLLHRARTKVRAALESYLGEPS